MRLVALAFILLAPAVRAAEPAAPVISVASIPSPTNGTATGPAVNMSPDGTAWLTWLEKLESGFALQFSTYDMAGKHWSAPRTIARGPDLTVGNADFPALTAGPGGKALAVWFVNNPATSATEHAHHGAGYRAYFSRTIDRGATWSAPELVTRESDTTEFLAVATLADGRVLATWLDGRAQKSGGKNLQLYSRILGTSGTDTLVDERVCDCCHTALTAFPDGTALLAYRGRSEEEARDIRVTRFRGAAWDEPRPLNNDDWRINGCPVNGPALASDGGRVAAAWFTAADNDPRVVVSFSPDAGARFLMPLRLSEGKTLGRVATVMLHDGALLVTHVDADGGLQLRRVTPDFVAKDTVPLVMPATGRVRGFPRLALLRDYSGGSVPAQFLAVFAREGSPGVHSVLVTVPEAELLEAEKNCDCAPTADQLQGFPIRGTLLAVPAGGNLRVQHFEVPGILTEGTREFRISAEVGARIEPGRQFLGRIEQRDGAWWLIEVRMIAMAPR